MLKSEGRWCVFQKKDWMVPKRDALQTKKFFVFYFILFAADKKVLLSALVWE